MCESLGQEEAGTGSLQTEVFIPEINQLAVHLCQPCVCHLIAVFCMAASDMTDLLTVYNDVTDESTIVIECSTLHDRSL